jgi:Peptidase A4 family
VPHSSHSRPGPWRLWRPGLTLPAGARAAAGRAASVPAPAKSLFVAGYEQLGCVPNAYQQYTKISGTIVVPTADDMTGPAGSSFDVYDLGGIGSGVVAGVSVDNAGGQAFYTAFAQWGYGAPVSFMPVQPGETVQVTIQNQGAPGYLVDITAAGETGFQTTPDTNASPCVAGAFEQSDYPTYDHLTQTTPVAFDHIRVWWAQQGQPAATKTKLLGTPPAHATLYRYSLVNSAGTVIAAASKPTDHDNNFTITDK